MPYDHKEHAHRFATWAACTAARASPKCRFEVSVGKYVMESSGLCAGLEIKAKTQNEFDKWHEFMRKEIVGNSRGQKLKIERMTAGVAAKLINVYLKTRYLDRIGQNESHSTFFHPPLDSLLIKGIKSAIKQGNLEKVELPKCDKWSLLTDEQYKTWIEVIAKLSKGKPLWTIEEYWLGHQ